MTRYATTEETFTCINCGTRATEQQLSIHEKGWSMDCPNCTSQVLLWMRINNRNETVRRAFVEVTEPESGPPYGRVLEHTAIEGTPELLVYRDNHPVDPNPQ